MKKLVLTLSIIFFYFASASAEIKIKSLSEGSVDAKISIIVYESLTCGHCADFHEKVYPKLKKDFINAGLVKIEFRSFPLDLAALNASKISHCKNDGNSSILHFLYSNQTNWVKGQNIEEVNKHLETLIEKNNFNIDFDECTNNKEIEDFVLNDRIEGVKEFKINATPTVIINNKKFDKALNYKNLKKFLEKLI